MTCRHRDPINDPTCSSYESPETQANNLQKRLAELKKEHKLQAIPSNEDFEIIEYWDYDPYLLLKIRYPSCDNCAFDNMKLLLFGGVRPIDVMRWKKVDPHFREPQTSHLFKDAPPPLVRFPASEDGLKMALRYCAWLQDLK